MKLTDSSRQKLEAFFREYLKDDAFCLPPIHFYSGKFVRVFTALIGVEGITFGRHIFIAPRLVFRNKENLPTLSGDLIAHETAHVLQYEHEGFVKFLRIYLGDFWENLRRMKSRNARSREAAYWEIPFEIEARETAKRFAEWNKNQKKDTTR